MTKKKRKHPLTPPREALALATKLRALPGVVGVFWGDRYKESERRWVPERSLCVHVQKKRERSMLPASQLLEGVIEGFPVDVLEVGVIRAHAIDAGDEVITRDGLPRSSAITGIAEIDGVPHALLSGHGTLPLDGSGRIPTSYSRGASSGRPILFRDYTGATIPGRLLKGRLGASKSVDFALARLEANPGDIRIGHPSLGAKPPFRVGSEIPPERCILGHYSRMLGAFREGTFRQMAAEAFEVILPDESTHLYTNAFVIDSNDGMKFSVPGDSGSAVVDEDKRIVGTLLGGNTAKPVSYVLPVWSLNTFLTSNVYQQFFSET